MKKVLGYLVIILIGVFAIISLIHRSEVIDNNLTDDSNVVEIFAKN